MFRGIILPVLFGIVALGLIGFTSPSYAELEVPQDIICENETITSGIFKSITVAPDSYCTIQNAEIIKDIRADNAQFVNVEFSTVGGNIVLNSLQYGADIFISTISKSVKIDGGIVDIQIHNSEIGKDLKITNAETFHSLTMVNSIISKNFELKNNVFYFDGPDSNEVYVVGNTISGNVQIKNNVDFVDLLFGGNIVGKNLIATKNLGDANYSDLNTSSNEISGKLEVKENTGSHIEAHGNIVNKNFKFSKNDVNAIHANGNTVGKNFDVSGHSVDFLSVENNLAKKIKFKDNHSNNHFLCDGNSPEPIMKKNTRAGLDVTECT